MTRPAVLFVCLGNICRSPLAEGALRQAAEKAGLDIDVDSAGTGGWHIGNPPDPRARDVARAMGCDIGHLRARQLSAGDFVRFTHILALDHANLSAIRGMRPADAKAETGLLLDFVPGRTGEEVADPYYGDADGFAVTWKDVTAGADGIVRTLLAGT